MKLGSNIRQLLHTLRYAKPVQIAYRLKYELNRVHSLKNTGNENQQFSPLSMLPIPSAKKFVEITQGGIKVTLLNKTVTYQKRIQWDYLKYGRLWNYHLQYADFLKQDSLSFDFRAELVLDLYRWLEQGKLRPEPYPASLRIMNVIRFLSENHGEIDAQSDLIEYLYSELHFLANRLEYHLLGNHLLENAFALLMGGIFFNKQKWLKTSGLIFEDQISEQILEDGGHFERSPMYQLILLFRFLEASYYLPSDSKLFSLFLNTSKKMLSWANQLSFDNGELAHFNDSTDQQSYSKSEIFKLAEQCGIKGVPDVELSDSGYRKFANNNFELLVDACGIEPGYQPGHAHADSLSFILHVCGQPVVIDPGTSTYESGDRRSWERSTRAHNTVTYDAQNTADVWSRFRVGRRPEVLINEQSSSGLNVGLRYKLHSGERFEHTRNFTFTNEFIEIKDVVNLKKPVEGRLYFHPLTKIKTLTNQRLEFENGIVIFFNAVNQISRFSYEYCKAFNSREISQGIEYRFIGQSSLKILSP